MQPITLENQKAIVGGFDLGGLNTSSLSTLITSITNSVVTLVSSITTVALGVDKVKNSASGSLKSDDLTISWDNASDKGGNHGGLIG